MKVIERDEVSLTEGGLMFEGRRTTLQHGDRIVYHAHGYTIDQVSGVDVGFLEVRRGETLLERQDGDTRFPFDNRFHGGCPGSDEPVNLLALVLNTLANMANLEACLCRSDYNDSKLVKEEYELAEPGCLRDNRSGKITRP